MLHSLYLRTIRYPCIAFVSLRLLSTILVKTWFVADEYWQATEIAHHMTFGYGYKTWEWQNGLRSVVYPGLFCVIYKILQTFRLDHPVLLIEVPRVFSALAFSVGDFHIWKLSKKLYGKDSANWSAVCLISSWFLEYCAPRTLTSSAEMVLSSVALYHYPWRKQEDSCSTYYLWLIGVACVIRPTSVILFLPLCLQHLRLYRYKQTLLFKYVIITVSVLSLTVLIDSLYYGHLLVVPWKFAQFNVVSGLASHYGTHPWHWYLTQGLPVTLTTHLLPFLLAAFYYPSRHKELLPLCSWCIFVYSCLSHKEFRFLLPILPLCLCIGGDYLACSLSSQAKKDDSPVSRRGIMIVMALFLPNILGLVYLGLIHQRGPLEVMHVLRQEINSQDNPDVLFLMPCHSTPFYSHLHQNVSMRFLTCEPNLDHTAGYVDEADDFEKDPLTWLHREYGPREDFENDSYNDIGIRVKSHLPLPTHILLFDILKDKIETFLNTRNYRQCHEIFNSHIVDGRRSKYILVYCR